MLYLLLMTMSEIYVYKRGAVEAHCFMKMEQDQMRN